MAIFWTVCKYINSSLLKYMLDYDLLINVLQKLQWLGLHQGL